MSDRIESFHDDAVEPQNALTVFREEVEKDYKERASPETLYKQERDMRDGYHDDMPGDYRKTLQPDNGHSRRKQLMSKRIRALTTAGALVLAGAFGAAVVLTEGSGNGATLGLFLAGGYATYQLIRGTNE